MYICGDRLLPGDRGGGCTGKEKGRQASDRKEKRQQRTEVPIEATNESGPAPVKNRIVFVQNQFHRVKIFCDKTMSDIRNDCAIDKKKDEFFLFYT